MADTPNNNIEKQLQDYAKQRREAVGTPEMHPATRAMLQAEVKQQLGATKPTPRAAGWAGFWPRLAFACGVLALLGIVAMFALPPGRKAQDNFTLAKLEEAKESRPVVANREVAPVVSSAPAAAAAAPEPTRTIAAKAGQPAPAAGDAPLPATVSISSDSSPARNESAVAFKREPERVVVASKSIASPGAPRPADRTKTSSGLATAESDTFALNDAPKAKPSVAITGAVHTKAAPAEVRTDGKLGFASVKNSLADKDIAQTIQMKSVTNQHFANAGQRYRNMAVADTQKKSDQLQVLEEFTVAQDGEMLTIVDRDGSIYNGYARLVPQARVIFDNNAESANPVQLVPNSGSGGRAGAVLDQRMMNRAYEQSQNARAITLDNAGQLAAQSQSLQNMNTIETANFVFRVEGTNRSLNQRVVFTGNILQNSGGNFADNNLQNFGNAANNSSLRSQQNVPQVSQGYFNNRQQSPMFNNSINGRVQLDGKRESELNALPTGQ